MKLPALSQSARLMIVWACVQRVHTHPKVFPIQALCGEGMSTRLTYPLEPPRRLDVMLKFRTTRVFWKAKRTENTEG
jgi:hypothetical protein